MKWIKFADEKPGEEVYKFICMYQDMDYADPKFSRKHIYITHITPDGYFHVSLRPYEDCWDVNTKVLKPIKWMPLPKDEEDQP